MPDYFYILLAVCVLLLAFLGISFAVYYNVFRTKRKSLLDPNRYPVGSIEHEAFKRAVEDNKWILAQNYETIELKAFDGVPLRAVLLTADNPTDKFLLCVHGHTSRGLYEFASISVMYRRNGFNVLVVDDRGHGDSGGKISFSILDRLDVKQWTEYLAERFPSCEVVLHGISMGSATVTQCASMELPACVKGVIADCGFTSPADEIAAVAKKGYIPRYPLLWGVDLWCKLLDGYSVFDADSLKTLPNAKVPMLFIHGTADTLVPPRMADEMYEACGSKKHIVRFEGAIHARSFARYPEEYEKEVLTFIADSLAEK